MRHVATPIDFPSKGPGLRYIVITIVMTCASEYSSNELEDLTIARDIAEFEKNISFARPATTLDGFSVSWAANT